jgi:hypothetical protein
MRTLLPPLAALLACAAAAQTNRTFLVPAANPNPNTNNYPFAGGIIRYQQWYSAAEWLATTGPQHPVRVNEVAFRAAAPGGQAGAQVEFELSIANGPAFGPSTLFSSNLVSGKVTVPRGFRTLGTATPGTFPMVVPLPADFVWDGQSAVVVEVRIWSNGRGNQPFAFDFEAAGGVPNSIARLFTANNPDAPNATVIQQGFGLRTRFQFQEGTTVPFGTGCPGAGNFVPEATTAGGLPLPGNSSWTHVVDRAASQRNATLLIGDSKTAWGAIPLPVDLGLIGATNCSLLVSVLVTASTMTVGGGPGAGRATIGMPIPPIPTLFGQPIYTQWIVLDPLGPNGLLSNTNGLWSIIGG